MKLFEHSSLEDIMNMDYSIINSIASRFEEDNAREAKKRLPTENDQRGALRHENLDQAISGNI